MSYIAIAEVTFFTNVPSGLYPTDQEAAAVSTDLAEQVEAIIASRDLSNELAVIRVEYELGCILTTLTIGAFIGAAGGAVVGFAKIYPKLRQSTILLLRDIHCLYTHVRDPDKRVTSWLYSDKVFKEGKLEETAKAIDEGKEKLTAKDTKRPRRRASGSPSPRTSVATE